MVLDQSFCIAFFVVLLASSEALEIEPLVHDDVRDSSLEQHGLYACLHATATAELAEMQTMLKTFCRAAAETTTTTTSKAITR
jgi:hypothetical protein